MRLLKADVWNIVDGTEKMLENNDNDTRTKFIKRRVNVLALIVLSVDPAYLYLLDEPTDPAQV